MFARPSLCFYSIVWTINWPLTLIVCTSGDHDHWTIARRDFKQGINTPKPYQTPIVNKRFEAKRALQVGCHCGAISCDLARPGVKPGRIRPAGTPGSSARRPGVGVASADQGGRYDVDPTSTASFWFFISLTQQLTGCRLEQIKLYGSRLGVIKRAWYWQKKDAFLLIHSPLMLSGFMTIPAAHLAYHRSNPMLKITSHGHELSTASRIV